MRNIESIRRALANQPELLAQFEALVAKGEFTGEMDDKDLDLVVGAGGNKSSRGRGRGRR